MKESQLKSVPYVPDFNKHVYLRVGGRGVFSFDLETGNLLKETDRKGGPGIKCQTRLSRLRCPFWYSKYDLFHFRLYVCFRG